MFWLRGTMLEHKGNDVAKRNNAGTNRRLFGWEKKYWHIFFLYVCSIYFNPLFVCLCNNLCTETVSHYFIPMLVWSIFYYIYYWIGSLIDSVAKSGQLSQLERGESCGYYSAHRTLLLHQKNWEEKPGQTRCRKRSPSKGLWRRIHFRFTGKKDSTKRAAGGRK